MAERSRLWAGRETTGWVRAGAKRGVVSILLGVVNGGDGSGG